MIAAIVTIAAAAPAIYQNIDDNYLNVDYDPDPFARLKLKYKRSDGKLEIPGSRPLMVRSPLVEKRTVTPDGTCGAPNGYSCAAQSVYGSCCGLDNWCETDQEHCGGGCQSSFGFCYDPIFQLAYDVDAGDVIWDPVSDNVFDAEMGDGMIFYGYPPEGDWPA